MPPDQALTATSVKPRRVKRARHILEGPALAEVTWLRFVRYLCSSQITFISSFISLVLHEHRPCPTLNKPNLHRKHRSEISHAICHPSKRHVAHVRQPDYVPSKMTRSHFSKKSVLTQYCLWQNYRKPRLAKCWAFGLKI